MSIRKPVLIACVVGLVAAGCTTDEPPEAGPTATPSSPTPTATPGAPVARAIVYSTWDPGADSKVYDATDRNDVWLYDVDTDTVRRLTDDGGVTEERQPRFVTATTVAWFENSEGKGLGSVWTLDTSAEGAAPKKVATISERIQSFDISPADPNSVAMLATDPNDFAPSVWIRDQQGTERIRDLPEALGRGGTSEDELRVEWSPDGSKLLVMFTPADFEKRTMFVMDRDGADVAKARFGTFGRWAPDGGSIYWRRWDNANWFALDLATDTDEELDVGGARFHPWVSPSGRFLTFDDDRPAPSVYVYDLQSNTETKIAGGVVAPVWLDDDGLIATQAEPCEERFGENADECVFSTWAPLGAVDRVAVPAGTKKTLALLSTEESDAWYA